MNNLKTLTSKGSQSVPLVSKTPIQQEESFDLQNTYLKFQLESEIAAAITVNNTEEAITVPWEQLTAIPNMIFYNLGLLLRRSRILWVFDLAAMLQIKALDDNTQKYTIIIAKVGENRLGLAVKAIDCLIHFKPDVIQPTHENTELSRHLHGCVLYNEELILVLNASAIIDSSLLHKSLK